MNRRNKIIFTIFLVILLMANCGMGQSLEKNSSKTDFEQYISLFEDIELPVVLDDAFLNANFIIKKEPIKADFIELFIKKNEEFGVGESLFDYYKFYPMVKFHISSSIIGIIHAEIGIAGGAEDRCILNLYTINGEKTDELIVWEYLSEGTYFSEITSIITLNKISLVTTGTEINEDEDSGKEIYNETYREEKEYSIDTVHGKIEIKKNNTIKSK